MSADLNRGRMLLSEIYVAVPWGTMAAKCWGDPCSKPVLVVHGIQDNAGSFDRLLPLLPICFYYVCMELPGHGKSSRIPDGFQLNFMHYLSAIKRFVKHFLWKQFYYMGHSLGGQLGVYYAAMYPDEVIKLITLDAIPTMSRPIDEFLEFFKNQTDSLFKLEEKISKNSPPNYTEKEAVERLISQRPSPITRNAAEALSKRMLKQGDKGFYFSMDQRLKLGVHYPMTLDQNISNISKIACPYLFILTKINYKAVESDSVFGSAKPILETFKKMKNISIVLVDGYHDVHNNRPEVVAPLISNFLIHHKSSL